MVSANKYTRAKECLVENLGNSFQVTSNNNKKDKVSIYNVSVNKKNRFLTCDCGSLNFQRGFCTHILAVFWKFNTNIFKMLEKFQIRDLAPITYQSLMSKSYNYELNKVKEGNNESSEHRTLKRAICTDLKVSGIDFITEAIFENDCRADIFIPSKFKAIEILHTETEDRFERKLGDYPSYVDILAIRTSEKSDIKLIKNKIEWFLSKKHLVNDYF